MREWEEEVWLRPVFRSEDVSSLFARLMSLRNLVEKGIGLERRYQSLKVESAISNYKLLKVNFISLGSVAILIPLVMVLIPPIKNEYIISLICLFFFIFLTTVTMMIILKSAKK